MEEEWHEGRFRPVPHHRMSWAVVNRSGRCLTSFFYALLIVCVLKNLTLAFIICPHLSLCLLRSINLVSVNLFTIKNVSILHALPVLKSTWNAKPILLSYMRFRVSIRKCLSSMLSIEHWLVMKNGSQIPKCTNKCRMFCPLYEKVWCTTTSDWLPMEKIVLPV